MKSNDSLKKWKFNLLAIFFIIFFFCLGIWQIKRGMNAKAIIQQFELNSKQPAVNFQSNKQLSEYSKIKLPGHFIKETVFLLDNQIKDGKVGYEIYTAFLPIHEQKAFLVDRGFVATTNRNNKPKFLTSYKLLTIEGLLKKPPRHFSYGPMIDDLTPPARIEFIDLKQIAQLIHVNLYPFILQLTPNQVSAFEVTLKITTMPPARHFGYATQWFALSITILLLLLAFNRNKSND